MTTSQNIWAARQRRMNSFTHHYLEGVGPLRVDGEPGPATLKRIKECKWWTGFKLPYQTTWTPQLDKMLQHPYYKVLSSAATVTRGYSRRRHHNRWVRAHRTRPATGVGTYDGVPCANIAMPILDWCRAHGWHGRLVSGYRDPAYSQSLCLRMCGHPQCPGTCAGLASNHVGATAARFAVDVSYYQDFRRIVANCPVRPHIFNALPQDPVHFSPSGR